MFTAGEGQNWDTLEMHINVYDNRAELMRNRMHSEIWCVHAVIHIKLATRIPYIIFLRKTIRCLPRTILDVEKKREKSDKIPKREESVNYPEKKKATRWGYMAEDQIVWIKVSGADFHKRREGDRIYRPCMEKKIKLTDHHVGGRPEWSFSSPERGESGTPLWLNESLLFGHFTVGNRQLYLASLLLFFQKLNNFFIDLFGPNC